VLHHDVYRIGDLFDLSADSNKQSNMQNKPDHLNDTGASMEALRPPEKISSPILSVSFAPPINNVMPAPTVARGTPNSEPNNSHKQAHGRGKPNTPHGAL
jgi:hypothetical protein